MTTAMPQPRPSVFDENRVCRMRHFAELGRCLALSAEMRGDAREAARLTLDAWLMEARADRLSHTSFDAVLADASAARLDRAFWGDRA